uniref:PGG domain-containing protein n=1 Tax=Arundo donax TaxID=35708 RepID=A0A0A9C8D9_ARUDO
MAMLQSERLVRRHALDAAIILDLFGLIGAYAAGSCRDTSTSIYTVAMAGAILIYVVIHIVFFTLDHSRNKKHEDNKLEKNREVLLLLAILAATLTYQAGLTPPGGLWESDKFGHHAGFPVLQDKYPRRYKTFFYCNAASFMASVALIILLMNPNLYRPGIECSALFVCMVAGMFGLMGAYAAGSSLHLKTSIIVLILVTALALAVFGIAAYVAIRRRRKGEVGEEEVEEMAGSATAGMPNYLMLVGILAASVTYLTGLKPPGDLWRYDGNGHSAGNPVLYDMDKLRYNVFFYNNSISFIASITIIASLLGRMMCKISLTPPWPMHTIMLLNMLALLGAYAAGSARMWGTSRNVILLLFPIVGFVGLLFMFCKKEDGPEDELEVQKMDKLGDEQEEQKGEDQNSNPGCPI